MTSKSLAIPAVALLALVSARSADAALVGITGVTTNNGNPATITAAGTTLMSFTVASGTYSGVSGSASSTVAGSTSVRAVGSAPNLASSTITDLDLSNGLANPGTFDVIFGGSFTAAGVAGASNDIFVFELGTDSSLGTPGDDSVTIQGIDSGNNLIGLALPVAVSAWGDTGKDVTITTNGSNSLTRNIAGIAFDVSDLNGGAALPGIVGIRITTASDLDPLSIGYTVVPEPSAAVLSILGLLGLAARRKR